MAIVLRRICMLAKPLQTWFEGGSYCTKQEESECPLHGDVIIQLDSKPILVGWDRLWKPFHLKLRKCRNWNTRLLVSSRCNSCCTWIQHRSPIRLFQPRYPSENSLALCGSRLGLGSIRIAEFVGFDNTHCACC